MACDICNDTGFVEIRDEHGVIRMRPCYCVKLQQAKKRLEDSGLVRAFKDKSFDTFLVGDNKVLKGAKDISRRYVDVIKESYLCDSNENKLPSLMLCGQSGAGKTHLGTACSKELLDGGIPVIYMGYREEIRKLKTMVTDNQAFSTEMNKYKNAKVLFIDDFLKGKNSEADVNTLYELINYRYNNNLPVILSTEKKPLEIMEFDEAIGGRLVEMAKGYIVVFSDQKSNYRIFGGE